MDDFQAPLAARQMKSRFSDRLRLWQLFVLAAIATAYAGWPNTVFIEAEDSIVFLGRIAGDEPAFHPNHLLFEPLYHALLQVARAVRPGIEPVLFLQGVTMAFGLLGLIASYGLVAPRAGHTAAVVGTGLVAMSFAFWHYSKVVDAYVPALSLALSSLVVFDRRSRFPRPVAALGMALLAGAAALLHQLYVFHAALLLVFLLLADRRQAGGSRDAGLYGLVSLGGVCAVYLAIYATAAGSDPGLAGFVGWAKGHAGNGLWMAPSAMTPVFATIGLGSGLVYVAPFLAVPGLSELAVRMSPGRGLEEETFIAFEVLGRGMSILLAVLAATAVALCIWLAGHAIRHRRRVRLDPTESYLLAFLILYGLLASTWEALNNEFWIHVLVAAALLVALRLRASGTATPQRVGLTAVALLGTVNFAAAIGPFSDPSNDFWRQATEPVVSRVGEDDVIAVECPWLCARYIEFLSGADVHLYRQLDGFDLSTAAHRERLTFERLDPVTLRPSGD